MRLNFDSSSSKEEVFGEVDAFLRSAGFTIVTREETKPWGGYFVVDEQQSAAFIELFFDHVSEKELNISGKLSPKILVVAPGKRLSWQYHHRRAEIWKQIGGTSDVATSADDVERNITTLTPGEVIELPQGDRHRLIGTAGWGIVAEIWRHTDANNPSDEEDIVRVEDDFGR